MTKFEKRKYQKMINTINKRIRDEERKLKELRQDYEVKRGKPDQTLHEDEVNNINANLKQMKNERDELVDYLAKNESVNNDYTDLKLEIYESYEANLITESEKDELLNILENTAYNKHHALDVKTHPADHDDDTKTNSKEEGKYIAKQKAFNKQVGIKDDKFIDMDIDEALYIKDKQRRKIDRAVEANKANKLQKDLNDPKKRGKYNVVLTGNGATLVDPREERKKELKKRIADRKKNQIV